MSGYANPLGYVYVYSPEKGMKTPAHRIIARSQLSAEDNIPIDWHCHHVCGNPRCVNPTHLEWLPIDEHVIADRRRNAEAAKPDDDLISAEEIREIRRRYESDNVTQNELADEYGLSQPMISNIVRRKQYWYIE